VKPVHCSACSRNISGRRYTDGLVEVRANNALFLCDACARKEQEKVDIEKRGEYTILQKVKSGGMSTVYKAWHRPTNRLVALKRVMPEIMARRGAREFFIHEAELMRTLLHPHIVHLIAYEADEEEFWFIFEYMPLGDLYTYAKMAALSLHDLCVVFLDILEALTYLHRRGVVHRDIKPHNILLTKDRGGKLGDFTLATRRGEPKPEDIGRTLLFLAPEEVKDHTYMDSTADVYSLGVSLFYVLTGKFPYSIPKPEEIVKASLKGKNANSLDAILRQKKDLEAQYNEALKKAIVEGDRIPIQKYRDIPVELANIIDQSVAKDERDRFSCAEDMKGSLLSFMINSFGSIPRK
jgi:serine/threonine protein kinase